MKILLVGAPESGKTELAQQVATALDECGIVDDYIPVVENRSNITMGHFATYIGNMMCALGRLEAERDASRHWKNLVICGSLLETSVYQAINAYTHNVNNANNAAFREASDKRASVTMAWLSLLRMDAWEYDLVFYLPQSEDFKADDENKWSSVVDDQIQAAAEALEVEMIALPTSRDDRVALVLQKVKELEDEATEVDGEPVGVGGEGSPENGNSDPDLPNVRDES